MSAQIETGSRRQRADGRKAESNRQRLQRLLRDMMRSAERWPSPLPTGRPATLTVRRLVE